MGTPNKRKLEFFQLIIDDTKTSIFFDGAAHTQTDALKKVIISYATSLSKNKSLYKNADKTHFVEILDVNGSTIFGVLGKASDVIPKVMQRIRDKENHLLSSTDLQIEKFRYFYFDVNALKIVAFDNSESPKIRTVLIPFIKTAMRNSAGMPTVKFNILPVADPDLKNKINRTVEINSLNINVVDPVAIKSHLNLRDISKLANSADVREISVRIKYRTAVADEPFKQALQDPDLKDEFAAFQVRGKDEADNNLVYEAIEGILTRTVTLTIDDEDFDHAKTRIKELLKAQLDTVI